MSRDSKASAAVIYSFPQTQAGATRPAGSLHHGLLDALRELVNHGDLVPGSRVPERQLCQRFAVSRTPLREALKVLAAEGLIELLPNRGARVAAIEEAGLRDLFEVIGLLEADAGRLACERMSDAAIAEVQSLHYRMYAHFLREELPEYFKLNQEIHQAILEGANNPLLVATHRTLAGRIIRARYLSNRLRSDRWKAAVEEHGQILDALVRRDGNALSAVLIAHLANKRDIITEHIRSLRQAQEERPLSRRRRRTPATSSPQRSAG